MVIIVKNNITVSAPLVVCFNRTRQEYKNKQGNRNKGSYDQTVAKINNYEDWIDQLSYNMILYNGCQVIY